VAQRPQPTHRAWGRDVAGKRLLHYEYLRNVPAETLLGKRELEPLPNLIHYQNVVYILFV
jgi:hypothetical protein